MEYKKINMPGLLHGGDYNPEQWLDRPDILEDDTNYHIYESILSRFLDKSVKETQSNLSKMKKRFLGGFRK